MEVNVPEHYLLLQVISIDLRTNLLEGLGVKVREHGTAHERSGDKTTEINYVHILNKILPPEIRQVYLIL